MEAGANITRSESLRFDLARLLVVVSFVWPFVNFSYFFPDSTVETNFVFVFVAIGLTPALLLEDFGSSLLAVVVIGIAAVWGPPDSALRLLIGIAPCLFLVSLHRHFLGLGKELIPRGVAYKALFAFAGFSVLQYVNFNLFQIIPDRLTNFLAIFIPRYMDVPYDESGARGVQGWASEPSSAAMACFSFCVVAMQQQPEKRRNILLLFTILAIVNKSVYGMLFLIFLVLAYLWDMRGRLRVLSAAVAFALVFFYFTARTNRVAELREHVAIYGIDEESNHELMRFAQVLYPLGAFPRMYTPVTFFEHEMQPLGLLPLLVGYGSVFGLLLYYRVIFRSFRLRSGIWRPLGLASILLLSFMSSPNFIPAIVAFTYAMTPIKPAAAASVEVPGKGWLGGLKALLGGSPAVIRQDIARASGRIQRGIT